MFLAPNTPTLLVLLAIIFVAAVVQLARRLAKKATVVQSLEASLKTSNEKYLLLEAQLRNQSQKYLEQEQYVQELEKQVSQKHLEQEQYVQELEKQVALLKAEESELSRQVAVLGSEKGKSELEFLRVRELLETAEGNASKFATELSEAKLHLARMQELMETNDQIEILRAKVAAFEEQHELVAAGLYPVSLDFGTPDELKRKLEAIRGELAEMIRAKTAAVCTTKWTVNGSTSEGMRATRHYIRIMLRTFNADADACLDLVRWNNLEKCELRLRASFEYVNELGSTHSTYLQEPYLNARVLQLRLMHQYRESLHHHKEAMRAARQAALEERKANREIERARNEAEAEEKRYAKALTRAREDVLALIGSEREQMLQTIIELERRLAEASLLKQRAISMAQITKAGFVYVISNIGSFGSDVLKIGMTRRIDPQERIRELGGASVPFHFDVHAMIYSENAPELENAFHRRFFRSRLNLANGRKEFFRVPLKSVVEFASELSLDAEFSIQPEARDFRISNQLRSTLSDEEINQRLAAMEQEPSFNDDEESAENGDSASLYSDA
ncbi:MAG: DUF4041 domain-containing protein [Caldilineaceae bacterium]